MITDALKYLVALGKTNVFPIGQRQFTDANITEVRPALPPLVEVYTLTGLVELVQSKLDPDNFNYTDSFVHVEDFDEVSVIASKSDESGQRKKLIKSSLPDVKTFPFNNFHPHDSFIIGLQSQFVPAIGDIDYLLKIASNINNEQVRTSTDDGISQEVGVKAGVVLKSTEKLKARVSLAPFRTFREIDQPLSDFVLRVKQDGQGTPQLGLFEADGGKWKITAMESIGRYLRVALPNNTIVV